MFWHHVGAYSLDEGEGCREYKGKRLVLKEIMNNKNIYFFGKQLRSRLRKKLG